MSPNVPYDISLYFLVHLLINYLLNIATVRIVRVQLLRQTKDFYNFQHAVLQQDFLIS